MIKSLAASLAASAGTLGIASAFAQDGPVDKGYKLLPANSAVAEEVHQFHNVILVPMMFGISLFVLALLAYVVFRFRAKANPNARQFHHNTLVEILWTGIPIIILLIIALPSFDLLFKEDVIPDGRQVVVQADGTNTEFLFANDFPEKRMVARADHLKVYIDDGNGERLLKRRADYKAEGLGGPEIKVVFNEAPARGEAVIIRGGRSIVGTGKNKEVALAPFMTLKVTGNQWSWTYSYPDFGDFDFLSSMLPEDQTTPELYRFEVDNRVVVPVGQTIRITTTASDVIHSWAMPNFAVKVDAVPGRINETWFNAKREGIFYGQCSEICGIKHSFMPIAVEVVSMEKFEQWVDAQRGELGMDAMFSDAAISGGDLVAEAVEVVEAVVEEEPAAIEEVAETSPVVAEAVVPSALPEVAAEVAATINRCQEEIDGLLATDTINFTSGQAVIAPSSQALLGNLATIANGCEGVRIALTGHTDSTGSEETNRVLSAARAQAVAAYLIGEGFSANHISAEGKGSAEPIADNSTRLGRAQNRRIEFTVSAPAAETNE